MTEMHKSTSPSEMEVKKSAKDNQYWREVRCNKPTWQILINCWRKPYC
jgi:hypothetical protein